MVLRSKLVSERISPFPRRSSFVLHVIGIARMQLLERTRPCTIGAQLNDVRKVLDRMILIPFSPVPVMTPSPLQYERGCPLCMVPIWGELNGLVTL